MQISTRLAGRGLCYHNFMMKNKSEITAPETTRVLLQAPQQYNCSAGFKFWACEGTSRYKGGGEGGRGRGQSDLFFSPLTSTEEDL